MRELKSLYRAIGLSQVGLHLKENQRISRISNGRRKRKPRRRRKPGWQKKMIIIIAVIAVIAIAASVGVTLFLMGR